MFKTRERKAYFSPRTEACSDNCMKTRFYKVMHFLLAGILKLVFRIHVHGRENEPSYEDGPYIIAANHICALDPIFLCAATKKQQPLFMAKKELFGIPVLKSIIKAFGAFPVNRNGADVGAVKKAIQSVKEDRCIGIFPQGKRCNGVNPHDTKVKPGVGMIAAHTQAQVLPVHIKTKNYTKKFMRRIDIYIGKPIKFEELNYDGEASGEYLRMSEFVFTRICDLVERDETIPAPESKSDKDNG